MIENIVIVTESVFQPSLIMLEAICLSLIGGAGFVILKDKYGKEATKHLALSCIVGLWAFSIFGEPTAITVIPYGVSGALAPAFMEYALEHKQWWKNLFQVDVHPTRP